MTPTIEEFRDTIAELEDEVSKLEAKVSRLEDDNKDLERELESARESDATQDELDAAAAEIADLEEANWQLENGMGEAIEALERGDMARALEVLELATRAPKWRDQTSCQKQFNDWLLERATAATGGKEAAKSARTPRKRATAA